MPTINFNISSIEEPTSSIDIKCKEDPRHAQCAKKQKKHTHVLVKQVKVEILST